MADKKYIGEPGKQDDPCWKGYEMVGMKKKGGRKVPNCVPEAREIVEKAKARVNEESSDTFPWHEDPKNPTRKVGERKDKYGNPVKNVARYLAKKAMKANEEAEQIDELSVKKLDQYRTRARQDIIDADDNDDNRMADKRAGGYLDASRKIHKKLAKEEVEELDEILPLVAGAAARYAAGKAGAGVVGRTVAGAATKYAVSKSMTKEEVERGNFDTPKSRRASLVRPIAKPTMHSAAEKPKKPKIENGNPDMSQAAQELRTARKQPPKPEVKPTMNPAFKPKTSQSRVGTLARVRAGMAKKAGANLKMDPDTGTPDHFTAAQRRKKGLDESANSVHVKTYDSQGNKQMNSPEFKKHVSAHGGELDYVSDKGAAFKFKSSSNAAMFHRGVQSKFKELDSEHDMHEAAPYQAARGGATPSDSSYAKRHQAAIDIRNASIKRSDEARRRMLHPDTAERKRIVARASKPSGYSTNAAGYSTSDRYKTVKEELGKENEWGTDALRQKYAAMTPGQEGLAADKIPTFDPRYDDVTTQYCGGLKEALLSEISAKGAAARADFRAKIQKVLADPAAISKAKKTLAKKKAAEKAAEPVHLVMQLRKASSIGSKVQFRNGESHHVAPNHVEKFNDKYHSLKSSIEKESLINRAHKSHADFFKAIAEETLDVTQQGGGPQYDTHRGNGGHMSTLELDSDEMIFADFDEKDMEELEAEVDNMTWEDIVDEYDDEELEYVDGEEEIEEGVTPQGRLKKKFSAMRNKTRRNMARNLALKRVSTPDRIKARSISTARRMVYQRFLRGRDKSSMSASEKSRIEAQVKRLAPSVARLSVRIVGQVRKLEQSRMKNRTRGKKR